MERLQKSKNSFFERFQNQCSTVYISIIVEYHLNRIRRMTTKEMIEDPLARMLLSEYLVLKNSSSEVEIILNWKCYELCKKIRKCPEIINRGKIFENLIHSSLSTIWENDLWIMIQMYDKNKDENELNKVLGKLQNDCIKSMENHSNFHSFCNDLHFKTWRIEQLLYDVYDNRKFKNYVPYFLDIENDPCFIV